MEFLFSKNLKNFRVGQKMSQEELAKKLGVSKQCVLRWECGDTYPRLDYFLNLCEILSCMPDDFFEEHLF